MASEQVSRSLTQTLRDLISERARIEVAIEALQDLIGQLGTTHRGRGRPPKVMIATDAAQKATRRWNNANRAAAAERMRQYWADRKKQSGEGSGEVKKRQKKAAKSEHSVRSKAWSPAARKAAAERMRQYWADRKKTSDES